MIERNPDFNIEITQTAAVAQYLDGKQVLACFENDKGIYAAQLLDKKRIPLQTLEIPFNYMSDVKYYIEGDNQDEETS